MFFALAEWVSSVLLLLVLSLVCAFVMATEQGPQNQSQGQGPSRLHALSLKSLKRTHDMFFANAHTSGEAHDTQDAQTARLAAKIASEYGHVKHLPFAPVAPSVPAKRPRLDAPTSAAQDTEKVSDNVVSGQAQDQGAEGGEESLGKLVVALDVQRKAAEQARAERQLVLHNTANDASQRLALTVAGRGGKKPTWHAPWKLKTVIAGHLGWVRCVSVEPGNEWFCTGSADRTIKLWDLASGTLKLTLTGHIAAVRGVEVSARHNYIFSCGEDRMIKCWDLEQNKVIRHYHGHLNGVYALALHPKLDLLVTGGRDSTARVWDIRTKAEVHVLTGHDNTVASILTQSVDPQVVTGSADMTIRLWDLAAGKTTAVLTHHKKSVRALVQHHSEFTFASAAADNIKKWKFPRGEFLHNLSGHKAVVNTLALNQDNVLVSGGDNGTLHFWDWTTGYPFQEIQAKVQPGSLEAEAGIFAATFDKSGSRLITCEADKSIKIWAEDEDATPETHPIDPTWKPPKRL